jgi:anti-sigma B factor antagonist
MPLSLGTEPARIEIEQTLFFDLPGGQRIMPCDPALHRPEDRGALMSEHPPTEFKVRQSSGVTIVDVRGRLTIGEPSDHFHSTLQSAIKGGARKVIVDLNGAPQIDSSGLSTLVRVSIQLAREGGTLRLVCGPGRVHDSLSVTRLIEAIPTFASESAALANF